MKFTLPDLPYLRSELEPYISRDTLYYHHDFHHKGYVNNLNSALEQDLQFSEKYTSLNDIILNYKLASPLIQQAIRNNAGGHLNHAMFWLVMCNHRSQKAKIKNYELISEAIDKHFGSFDKFTTEFQEAGNKLFGSGWVWLVLDERASSLKIITTPGHDNPISVGLVPLLVLDVWEHAYYLDYKNNRSKFVANFFNIINWEKVDKLYSEALKTK